jgi:hypothetical protein
VVVEVVLIEVVVLSVQRRRRCVEPEMNDVAVDERYGVVPRHNRDRDRAVVVLALAFVCVDAGE